MTTTRKATDVDDLWERRRAIIADDHHLILGKRLSGKVPGGRNTIGRYFETMESSRGRRGAGNSRSLL